MANVYSDFSLEEILNVLRGMNTGMASAAEAMMLYQRLMDIAFMEHGISENRRHAAEEIAKSLYSEICQGASAEAVELFNNAIRHHNDSIARFGRGTILWEIEEADAALKRADVVNESDFQERVIQHLNATSDTIAALYSVVHFGQCEILKRLSDKNVFSLDDIESFFADASLVYEDETGLDPVKAKMKSSFEIMRNIVFEK